MNPPTKRLYVVAGTWVQYENWRRANRFSPRDAVYLDSLEKIVGQTLTRDQIVYVGTPETNPNLADIEKAIRVRLITVEAQA